MNKKIEIGKNVIADDMPTYIIAEMSGNHNMDFERAKRIVREAADVGADAIKIQTYTPDTITIDCDDDIFKAQSKIWEGMSLYKLYQVASATDNPKYMKPLLSLKRHLENRLCHQTGMPEKTLRMTLGSLMIQEQKQPCLL